MHRAGAGVGRASTVSEGGFGWRWVATHISYFDERVVGAMSVPLSRDDGP
jgi:hypothetical protein